MVSSGSARDPARAASGASPRPATSPAPQQQRAARAARRDVGTRPGRAPGRARAASPTRPALRASERASRPRARAARTAPVPDRVEPRRPRRRARLRRARAGETIPSRGDASRRGKSGAGPVRMKRTRPGRGASAATSSGSSARPSARVQPALGVGEHRVGVERRAVLEAHPGRSSQLQISRSRRRAPRERQAAGAARVAERAATAVDERLVDLPGDELLGAATSASSGSSSRTGPASA